MIKALRFGIVFLLLFLYAGLIFAHQIDTISLTQKLPVLNKRAFFKFPAKAANIARSGSIMSADPNQDVETRIILDTGKMRLVFFAQELYKFAGGDFVDEIKTAPAEANKKQQVLINKNNVLAVLSTPVIFDSTKSAILVNTLLVKTKDSTIFRVDAYINPAGYAHRTEFIRLAEKVFATLQIGPRLNNRTRREQNVNIWGTKANFKLAIPKNYCVSVDRKYDFQVIRFHRYTEYRDTDWVDLMIYTGNHPWKDYEHYKLELNSAVNVPGTFLSEPITWLSFTNDEKRIYIKEQKIPFDKVQENLVAHLGLISNKAAMIAELTKIAEAIRLEKH